MSSDEVKLTAADGIVETEVGGQVALFHPGRQAAAVLNDTASDLWRLSDGAHSLDEVVDLLADAYGTTADAIRPDVLDAVESLRVQGFLRACL